MTELFQASTVNNARELIDASLQGKRLAVKVSLKNSLGKCLAVDVWAEENVPGFDRSTMDGFAVKSRDTFGASESLPAYVNVSGEVFMGKNAADELKPGQACKIPTGGMLPPGADAVVMLEHTEILDDKTIGITRPVGPGENMISCGEDAAKGDQILPSGHIIRPQDLGLLSAVGVFEVEVKLYARVGIISTGDEIIQTEEIPGPGQMRDVNSYTLYGQVLACGGEPVLYGIAGDNFSELKGLMEKALQECDMVLLSGGSSVGTRDIASKVIEELGSPGILFHGISIKPGKPTVGAVINNKPVFGLPGHPVSAMVVFQLMVEPLVRRGEYCSEPLEFPVQAEITRNIRSSPGREDYIRVILKRDNDNILAEPVLRKSALINTMVKASGLAKIPAGKEGLEKGERAAVKLF
ncbi:MAG: molybdopterin molybdotransferase MoeA [Clostridiales bacterium]|nr:molybdopterin molybdotransferase MoeA [Clostridiales bacterium]MCF8022062.1 molybdopterin molybdotransferase MoeA [Clostridiales bacterium]